MTGGRLVTAPPGQPVERPGWERPVRVKVGRGKPYSIGTVQGTTWPEVSRALAAVLRAAADEIDRQLERQERP